jgi:hypothetical protein
MRCILHGHRPVREDGKKRVGWTIWCPDCGTVFERGGEPEGPVPKPPPQIRETLDVALS